MIDVIRDSDKRLIQYEHLSLRRQATPQETAPSPVHVGGIGEPVEPPAQHDETCPDPEIEKSVDREEGDKNEVNKAEGECQDWGGR